MSKEVEVRVKACYGLPNDCVRLVGTVAAFEGRDRNEFLAEIIRGTIGKQYPSIHQAAIDTPDEPRS